MRSLAAFAALSAFFSTVSYSAPIDHAKDRNGRVIRVGDLIRDLAQDMLGRISKISSIDSIDSAVSYHPILGGEVSGSTNMVLSSNCEKADGTGATPKPVVSIPH